MSLSSNQQGGLAALLLVGLAAISGYALMGPSDSTIETEPEPEPVVENIDPHTVLFVVLDTVRSENLNLCGYDRPNTPMLNRLRDQGAVFTCDAHSPSFWTLPSHVSYFTGLPVAEHGALKWGNSLPDDVPTLAEQMAERGYRTAMVAANPLFNKVTGMQRGFEMAHVQKGAGGGKQAIKGVRRVLKNVGPDEKLFLFVNIFDAHDPYPAIPEGVGWVDAQEELNLGTKNKGREDGAANPYKPLQVYTDFVEGKMNAEDEAELKRKVRNGYDYGIYQADKILSGVLSALIENNRAESYRLIVTSDHGEFLGEHQQLRHHCCTNEVVTRVPLMFSDSTLEVQPDLSGNLSAMVAYNLVKDGRLPTDAGTPTAIGSNPGRDYAEVAMWATATEKVVAGGELRKYDLAADPGELAPMPIGGHPLGDVVTDLSNDLTEKYFSEDEVDPDDPEMAKLLEQMGYVDPD